MQIPSSGSAPVSAAYGFAVHRATNCTQIIQTLRYGFVASALRSECHQSYAEAIGDVTMRRVCNVLSILALFGDALLAYAIWLRITTSVGDRYWRELIAYSYGALIVLATCLPGWVLSRYVVVTSTVPVSTDRWIEKFFLVHIVLAGAAIALYLVMTRGTH